MRIGVLVTAFCIGCAAPATPSSQASTPDDAPAQTKSTASVLPTPVESGTAREATPQPSASTAVDPASCVDEGYARWLPRSEDLLRQVDETLPKLESCGKTRDERLAIAFYFRPDGTLVRNPVALSTTKDCKLTECIRKGLADIRVSPADKDASPYWVTIALAPENPPQRVTWTALEGDGWQWSRCGDEKERLKLPEGLLTGALRGVVTANADVFRRCYEQGLARNACLEGRVELLVVLESDGSARSVKVVGNTVPDCTVVECTRVRFSRLKFPESKTSGRQAYFPIKYQPQR